MAVPGAVSPEVAYLSKAGLSAHDSNTSPNLRVLREASDDADSCYSGNGSPRPRRTSHV